jgi:hypothetical protein
VTPHVAMVLEFLLTASANQAIANGLRLMALDAVLWIVRLCAPLSSCLEEENGC